MAPRTKAGKKSKVRRVMKEYKQGKLKGGKGRHPKVKRRKQAIAIALSESGQSRNKATRNKKKRAKR